MLIRIMISLVILSGIPFQVSAQENASNGLFDSCREYLAITDKELLDRKPQAFTAGTCLGYIHAMLDMYQVIYEENPPKIPAEGVCPNHHNITPRQSAQIIYEHLEKNTDQKSDLPINQIYNAFKKAYPCK